MTKNLKRTKLILILLLSAGSAMYQAVHYQALAGPIADRLRERLARSNNSDITGCTKCQLAGLDVAVWKPNTDGKAPLVIFSHGFGGSSTQSAFLMRAMAQAGYLVVAPNHKDANRSQSKPEVGFGKADNWSDKTYISRHDDMVNLIEALHKDASWNSQIDWSKIGLCGHSLGGYTVLGLAGAWPSWRVDGVKAVIALSPYVTPYTSHGNLDKLNAPVMYQGGTHDWGITPFVKRPGGAYSKTGSPAYFIDFDGFNHLTWTGFNQDQEKQEAINYYCVAFLDKYLKGENDDRLQKKLPGVIELECK